MSTLLSRHTDGRQHTMFVGRPAGVPSLLRQASASVAELPENKERSRKGICAKQSRVHLTSFARCGPQEDVDAAASVVQRRSPARGSSAAPLSHSASSVSQKVGRAPRKVLEDLADGPAVRRSA